MCMRKFCRHSFLMALILLGGIYVSPVLAQEQKIGYVDTDFILSKMPAYEGIQQDLKKVSASWKEELKKMEQELEKLREDFEAKEILYTEEQRLQKEKEIQSMERQRQQYLEQKFGADGEYFQKQQELLEPIQRRIFQAINAVAKRQGFDFVFDQAQNSSMLFGSQKWNLNDQVLQQLDVTLNETSN